MCLVRWFLSLSRSLFLLLYTCCFSFSILASISRISTAASAAWTNRPNDVDSLRRLRTIMYVQRNAFCISSRFVVDDHCRLFLLFVVVGDNYAKGIDTWVENERKCVEIILMTFVTDGNPSSNDDTIGELKSIGNLLSIWSVRRRVSYLITNFSLSRSSAMLETCSIFDYDACTCCLLVGSLSHPATDVYLSWEERNFHFHSKRYAERIFDMMINRFPFETSKDDKTNDVQKWCRYWLSLSLIRHVSLPSPLLFISLQRWLDARRISLAPSVICS